MKESIRIKLIEKSTGEIINCIISETIEDGLEKLGFRRDCEQVVFDYGEHDSYKFKIHIIGDDTKYMEVNNLVTQIFFAVICAAAYKRLILSIKEDPNYDWKSCLKAIRKFRRISNKRNNKCLTQALRCLIHDELYDGKEDIVNFITRAKVIYGSEYKLYKNCDMGNL